MNKYNLKVHTIEVVAPDYESVGAEFANSHLSQLGLYVLNCGNTRNLTAKETALVESEVDKLILEDYIIDNRNLIIAPFMGMQDTSIGWYDYDDVLINVITDKSNTFNLDELKFDTDWNWVMLVIEKINQICKADFKLSEFFDDTTDLSWAGQVLIVNEINAVVKEIVAFIEFYNAQTK